MDMKWNIHIENMELMWMMWTLCYVEVMSMMWIHKVEFPHVHIYNWTNSSRTLFPVLFLTDQHNASQNIIII